MYRAATLLAVFAVTSVFPWYVQAQQAEMSLVTREAMQEELKLTPEQKEQFVSIAAEYREASRTAMRELFSTLRGMSETDRRQRIIDARQKAILPIAAEHYEKLKAVLKPEQMRRLKEVAIQYTSLGSLLVSNPHIAKELDLSDDQKERIADTNSGTFGVRATQAVAQERNEGVLAILTDDQRNSLESMKGKPFDLEKLRVATRQGAQGPPFAFFLTQNDKNSDGKLTESETTEGFWRSFGRFDTNGDDAIDKDEIAKGMAERPQGQRFGGRGEFPDAMFARYDKNSDGKLSESEATEQVWSTYGEFDTNKDSAVDKAEFAKGVFKRLEKAAGRRLLGVSSNSTAGGPGLLVTIVRDGSPAAAAGIKVGDRFLGVDGKKVSKGEELGEAVRNGGKKLTLAILRDGEQLDVTVTFPASEAIANDGEAALDTKDWKVLVQDEFERPEIGEQWNVLSGEWTIENGVLRCTFTSPAAFNKREARIQFSAEEMPDTLEVEYDTWGAEGVSSEVKLMNGDATSGYIAAMNWFPHPALTSRGRKGTGPILWAKNKGRYKSIGDAQQFELKPDQRYRIRVQRQPNRLTFFVDGTQVLSERISPLNTPKLQLYGFGLEQSGVYFDNLRVRVSKR